MTTSPRRIPDIASHLWRKSSFSGSGTGTDCVQIAVVGEAVYVRDSKNPEGPVLRFSTDEMRGFIHGVKAGEFDSLT